MLKTRYFHPTWTSLSLVRRCETLNARERDWYFTRQNSRATSSGIGLVSATTDPKPFSAIPQAGGNMFWNIFELYFQHGGIHRSLYRIQENMIKDHGPICRKSGNKRQQVFIGSPDGVRTILNSESKYPTRLHLSLLNDFYARENKEPGVFFMNGEKWRKHKMLLSKKMLRPPQINAYIPRIDAIATEMVDLIKRARNSDKNERYMEVDDINMELFKWSFETVTNFLFDRRFFSLDENPPPQSVEFIKMVCNFLESFLEASFIPTKFYQYIHTKAFKKFNRSFLWLYNFAEELIEERLNDLTCNQDNPDYESKSGLIPFLLASKVVGEDEISSSIVDTLFAGIDSTSTAMQWMLYLLAKNPDIQQAIRDEVSHIQPGTQIQELSLQKIPLLKAAIKETLRLYPVVIQTPRILHQDTVISGYNVPKGTWTFIMNHAMGRREDLFPNADSFMPERWLRKDNRLEVDAFSSIPFGFGVRMCVGRRLAELELKILFIKILQNFRLAVPQHHTVHPYLRATNVPDKPIRVKFFDLQ